MKWNDNRIIMFDDAIELLYNRNIINDINVVASGVSAPKQIVKAKYKLEVPENFKVKIIDLRKEV